MIIVWSVCVGDKYDSSEVVILRDQVARNLRQSHRFMCITDRQIDGVNCLPPSQSWPGWFAKFLIFRHGTEGQNLYLDLDSVVVGDLQPLLSKQLSAPKNWAQSGHNGVQSSVMSWFGDWSFIADSFDASLLRDDPRHPFGRYGDTDAWGDQGVLTLLLGNPGEGKIEPMSGVYSYRYHCQKGPPPDASVICFHGEPKPRDVRDEWVHHSRQRAAAPAAAG